MGATDRAGLLESGGQGSPTSQLHFLLAVEPWVLLEPQFAYQGNGGNNSCPTREIQDVKAILKQWCSLGLHLGNNDGELCIYYVDPYEIAVSVSQKCLSISCSSA